MNRIVANGLCGAMAATLLGMARGAEDKPAPPAPAAPPAESAIAGAKRDFDTIKSAKELQLGQKSALPRMSVPDLNSSPGNSGAWTPSKSSGTEKKSTNWLVDAMEKKPESRNDRSAGKYERDQIRESRDSQTGVERGKSDAPEARDEPGKAPTTAVNPFTRYLGDWMTPQDYALLKPDLEKPSFGVAESSSKAMSVPGATPSTPAPSLSEATLGATQLPSVAGSRAEPRPNPYLQSMNLLPPLPNVATPKPVVVLAPAVVSTPGGQAGGTSAPAIGPSQLPPAKSRIPEFVKPQTDEKYFKQLKRF